MGRLGLNCETGQKTYYVDGHEKPKTKKCRKTMVSEYFKSELRMHKWIQLPLVELKALEVKLEIKINTGHRSLDPEQFGGLLSVGASQRMHFVPSDAGPYWMPDPEKYSNRKDSLSGRKIK
jgi:hypothetical protein